MKNVELSVRAMRERNTAIGYVLEEFGVGRAIEFKKEIDRTVESIVSNPKTFPVLKKGSNKRRIMIRKQISIIYTIKKEKIYIVSFWSHRQGPNKMKLK